MTKNIENRIMAHMLVWKDAKQLSNYIEEAMESDSYDSSTDKNTVYKEFVPG